MINSERWRTNFISGSFTDTLYFTVLSQTSCFVSTWPLLTVNESNRIVAVNSPVVEKPNWDVNRIVERPDEKG